MAEITSILHESRQFSPSPEFVAESGVDGAGLAALHGEFAENPEQFWANRAAELFWKTQWKSVFSGDFTRATWFDGGATNLAWNCLERNIERGLADKTAILWEGEPGEVRKISFAELHREVCQAANVLDSMGVAAGDRVIIYMPLIVEAAVAMLACARVGAVHSVVFGGFSAEALRDRLIDSRAKVVVTADGGYRRGQTIALKENVDKAAEHLALSHVLVVKRTGQTVTMKSGRDTFWHDVVPAAKPSHDPKFFAAEHPLFTLYTSGTTGKPKGILHTTGGYMVGAHYTSKLVFDLKDSDVFWCTADIGWVTGHSYTLYGALLNGTTTLLYEGAPNQPDWGRFWRIIEKHGVTVFYTAPTAIRAFSRAGTQWPQSANLASLRLLGSVGEPINPEAWMWYHEHIGAGRCPIVDTWWQTETGSIMIAPVPGAMPTKPGSCTKPLPGIEIDVVNKQGQSCAANEGGFLIIKRPWPSMLRTIWGDHDRFVQTYLTEIPGAYFAGDGARKDEDGYFWVMGRVDDVINVAGHRLSTMEVESALVAHPDVAEAAVVGKPDALKGQAICAFVTPKSGVTASEEFAKALREHVVQQIGALARPEEIRFADALPKTRSGKIMRRLLRDVAAGTKSTGDTTTLEDAAVLSNLAAARSDEE